MLGRPAAASRRACAGAAARWHPGAAAGLAPAPLAWGAHSVFEGTPVTCARWVTGEDKRMLADFEKSLAHNIARDAANNLTYLAPNSVNLQLTQERWPGLKFHATREHAVAPE